MDIDPSAINLVSTNLALMLLAKLTGFRKLQDKAQL